MAKRNSPPASQTLDPEAAQLEALMTGIEPMVVRIVEDLHDSDKAEMIKRVKAFFVKAKQVPQDGSLFTVLGLTDDSPDED